MHLAVLSMRYKCALKYCNYRTYRRGIWRTQRINLRTFHHTKRFGRGTADLTAFRNFVARPMLKLHLLHPRCAPFTRYLGLFSHHRGSLRLLIILLHPDQLFLRLITAFIISATNAIGSFVQLRWLQTVCVGRAFASLMVINATVQCIL